MKAALELVSEADFDKAIGPENTVAEIRKRYEAFKKEFPKEISWDQSIAAMAKDLGQPYTTQFMAC
jgi:hypothetical protein